jgi:hypothetical protein
MRRLGELFGDNHFVFALFMVLAVVNAFAMAGGYYG